MSNTINKKKTQYLRSMTVGKVSNHRQLFLEVLTYGFNDLGVHQLIAIPTIPTYRYDRSITKLDVPSLRICCDNSHVAVSSNLTGQLEAIVSGSNERQRLYDGRISCFYKDCHFEANATSSSLKLSQTHEWRIRIPIRYDRQHLDSLDE